MAYPQSLSGLSPREQIADLVVRGCLAFDSNDKPLFESVWASSPDISLNIEDRAMIGLSTMEKQCFDTIGPMDTQHLISSIRIDVEDGAETAHMTANALAQHYRKGEGVKDGAERMLVGSTYDIQVVKEKEGWKIMTWALKVIWKEGSQSVMSG